MIKLTETRAIFSISTNVNTVRENLIISLQMREKNHIISNVNFMVDKFLKNYLTWMTYLSFHNI